MIFSFFHALLFITCHACTCNYIHTISYCIRYAFSPLTDLDEDDEAGTALSDAFGMYDML